MQFNLIPIGSYKVRLSLKCHAKRLFWQQTCFFMGFSHAHCELHEITWHTAGPLGHKINCSVFHSFPNKWAKQLNCVSFLWAKYPTNSYSLLPSFGFDFKAFRTVLFNICGIIYSHTINEQINRHVLCGWKC